MDLQQGLRSLPQELHMSLQDHIRILRNSVRILRFNSWLEKIAYGIDEAKHPSFLLLFLLLIELLLTNTLRFRCSIACFWDPVACFGNPVAVFCVLLYSCLHSCKVFDWTSKDIPKVEEGNRTSTS